MLRPKCFVVFGELVPIEYRKGFTSNSGFMGEYDKETKEIVIEADLDDKDLAITLLHEMGHAIEDRISINQAVDKDVFEIITDTFAKCITENFHIKPR